MMTMTAPAEDATSLFLKSWRVYQEIIEHNYMFHREISAAAHAALEDYNPDQKLNVIDLGCGDASMALPLLSTERIARYIGCDLSQPALDIAKGKLAKLDVPYRVYCDDMLNVMTKQPDASAHLMLASYAIHHLNANDKQRIIREIARVLSPGGILLLIDIFREPEEERIDYMTNYMAAIRKTWKVLSKEAQALVIDHATQYDFPELAKFYEAICAKHSLHQAQRLAKHTWHEAWVFKKTSTGNQ